MRGGKRKMSRKYLENAYDLVSARKSDEMVPESEDYRRKAHGDYFRNETDVASNLQV